MADFDANNELHTQIQYRLLNKLSESERRYRELVENLREIVFKCDQEGKLLFINQAWTTTLGYSSSDSLGQPLSQFIDLQDHALWQSALETLDEQSNIRQELRFYHQSGEQVWLELSMSTNQQGEISGSLVDITASKQAKLLLEQTNEILEDRVQQRTADLTQANQELTTTLGELQRTQMMLLQAEKMSSLSHLVGGVAHEINNPVNFIQGNLKYLKQDIQDLLRFVEHYLEHSTELFPELQDLLQDIDLPFLRADLPKMFQSMETGAKRIHQIVLALQNFSRMDEVDWKRVDLHEGMDSTLMLLQHRLQHDSVGDTIALHKQYGDMPCVECYPDQINQVMMSLLLNAIEAIEARQAQQELPSRGELTLQTTLVNDQWVQIRVTDNGIGIPEEQQTQIFNPFFTTKGVGQGIGMNLALSYQIITENHHGRISVCSQPGVHTTFVIDLPIKRSQP
ncbi:MAG: PAS domain S-box protein [Spirulina sp. SIO3F2]|nr:PAS domain S-box protein [Spirulina sp. SIO3F2]